MKKRRVHYGVFSRKSFQQYRREKRLEKERRKGFTLIEILVVIGIIAVLSAVVLVAINPTRQFKLARDSQRISNVESLLSAIGQNIAEHKGLFTCGTSVVTIPASTTIIRSSVDANSFDIASCLVPAYISILPFDPSAPTAHYATTTDYNTEYTVAADSDGRITVAAHGEINPTISVTR